MKVAVRGLLSIVALVATFFFVFWMWAALLPASDTFWMSYLLGGVCGAGACWFVWTKSAAETGEISSVLLGAIVVGAIGFSVGFFGPMIFMPSSNQGPLLGLFFTGPIGFLIGALGGLIYARIRRPPSID
jgi:hypothetical protein